jgi:MFS family permease
MTSEEAQQPVSTANRPLLARLFGGERWASMALPQFRWLMAGTAFAQIASWMEEVARGWLILSFTHSALQLAVFACIRGFSQLLVSPFAGVLIDRLDRRRLAVLTQVLPGANSIFIAVLVSTGQIELWMLYPLVAIGGVAVAINMPVRQVLVYDVVGPDYITNAIALNAVVSNGARIMAPIAGGATIALIGIGASYYTQGVFFGLATLATLTLHPIIHADTVREPYLRSIRGGLRYTRMDPTVARLILLNVIPCLLIYPYVALLPIFAEDILSVGSTGYGILLTGVGVGSIPGGLIVAGMHDSRWKGRLMGIAACTYMAMVTLFALSNVFLLSFAILCVAGVGWSMMVTLNQTLLQMNVADEYRGRVLSLYTMASGATPFGNLGMGATASVFSVQAAVASFALTACALAAVLGIGSADVREL